MDVEHTPVKKEVDWYPYLVALRFLAVFISFGYLHPDGFFQGPEVIAQDVFGFATERPWEFTSSHVDAPARTIVTPAITCGIPFMILKFLSSIVGPRMINTYSLLYFPRFFLLLCSFIVDYTAYELSGFNKNALLVAASSWVTFSFLLTPFSNTVETLLLCLLLLSIFNEKLQSLSLTGAIMALGLFNRFSFSFYVLPVVLYLFWRVINDKPAIGKLISELSTGFFLTSFLVALVDSIYFGSLVVTIGGEQFQWSNLLSLSFWTSLVGNVGKISFQGSLVVTPLNNLRYNLNPTNQALHGLHPRWLHAAVNLPLLFGPLLLAFVIPWSNALDEFVANKFLAPDKRAKFAAKTRKPPRGSIKGQPKINKHVELLLIACLVSSVACHSISKHQELRFLIPNLVLLAILGSQELLGPVSDKYWRWGWVGHCVFFTFIFAFLHQGGMIPAIANIQSFSTTSPGTTHVIFYHTYMPPKHLLAISSSVGPHSIQVYDLQGPDTSKLIDARTKALRISEGSQFQEDKDKILFVCPGTIDPIEELTGEGKTGTEWRLWSKHWGHLSMEDGPEWAFGEVTKLSLNIYERVKK